MNKRIRLAFFTFAICLLSLCKINFAFAAESILWFPLDEYEDSFCVFGNSCYTGHNGTDYAIPEGTALYAPISGEVILSENSVTGQVCNVANFGNFIKIRSGSYDVILGHMKYGTVDTHDGYVEAGDFVGYSSNSGYTKSGNVCGIGGGYHVHVELRYDGTPVDPELYWASDPPRKADGSSTTTVSALIDTALTTSFVTNNTHNKRKNSVTGVKESPNICLTTENGVLHWWGYSSASSLNSSNAPTFERSGSYEYKTLYTQDYTGSCTGAIVYDDWGGSTRAYVVQDQQWDGWLDTNGPVGNSAHEPVYCGNPITNVYGKGHKWVQDFQDCRITYHPDDSGSGANDVQVLDYPNTFAPGEFASSGWDDLVSYAIARKYEKYGASKHFGYPLSGVCHNGDRYLQTFSDTTTAGYNRVIYYDLSDAGTTVTNSSKLTCSYVASSITDEVSTVETQAADDTDADNDGATISDGDCDDTDETIHPDHPEWYDGIDNDCDGAVDNDLIDQSSWDYTSQVPTNLAAVDLADLSSSVTCAVDAEDSLYVVLNGQDGRIYEFESTDDGNTWTSSPLTSLAAVPLSAPGTTPHLFIDPDTGDRYVTFMGVNARVNLFHYNGTSWTAVELTSVVAAPLGDITSSPYGYIANGVIYVVFQGNDQRIWWFTVSGATYGSLDLTGRAAVEYAMPGTSPMAVYNDLTGEHHIVFQGINQRIQRLTYNGSTWSSVEITSVINSDLLDTASSPYTYVDPFTGYVYTVINGVNERIDLIADYHTSWDSDELTSLVSVPLTEPGTSPTGYIDPFTGNHVITLQGDNGRINQFEGPDMTAPTDWTSIDQTSQAAVEYAASGTSPATCVDPFTGVRHTAFVGDNGRIQYLRYGP